MLHRAPGPWSAMWQARSRGGAPGRRHGARWPRLAGGCIRGCVALLAILALGPVVRVGRAAEPADPADPTAPAFAAADLDFFEKHVRPVFVKHCHACHSADADDIRSGLRLDDRAALLAGGDGGVVVEPGRPEASRLLAVLRSTDPDVQMPPPSHGGPLPAATVEFIATWIARGLPMPAAKVAAVDPRAALATHWAFQPIAHPTPPEVAGGWAWSDVDRFVLAALAQRGLVPVADATPAARLRRLHFDLTGLPPEPAEVEAFLADPGPARWESAVDTLLASPRFGERWGRHWLDVARYAESSGKETDFAYPHAWRYRDYVIAACDADMPFDQFIREQIAGDFFTARDDRERAELLAATGFLALGPKSHTERNRLQFEMDLVDEQIDTIGQAFLGLTLACARCHDHKYDPVSQRDYYALAGIFRSTDTRYGTIRIVQNNNPGDLVELPRSAGQPDGLPPLDAGERERLVAQIERLQEEFATLVANRENAAGNAVRNRTQLAIARARLDTFLPDGTPRQFVACVLDRPAPRDSEIFLRGEVEKPGAMVPRGLPGLAGHAQERLDGSGRLELANWIAAADNPLTPRVIVNRVWLHLFGRGLVNTPDNFGRAGEAPSHPELLDHLAAGFVADGWSVKRLIRRLVTTHAYALSTATDPAAFAIDPDNTLLWRMTPRRLDAEAIRDGILFTSGQLRLDRPTGSPLARQGEGFAVQPAFVRRRPLDEVLPWRSVYVPLVRGNLPESLALFDVANGITVTGQRPETTVPAQSLLLFNNPWVIAAADAAAKRVWEEAPSDGARVELAYLRWFGRKATEAEVDAARAFIADHATPRGGWLAFCQALFASHEFLARN
jgi:hypothetical protein